MKVTKDTVITDILQTNPEAAKFLFEIGMHCVGCPSAGAESLEQACEVHGADVNQLVEKINTFLNENS